MDKEEILRGMKLSRAVYDKLLEEKFVLKSEIDTGTSVTPSGLAIEVGDNQPTGNKIWLDTSAYASLQGATPNYLVGNGGTLKVVASDTEPTDYDLWLDTSNNGG